MSESQRQRRRQELRRRLAATRGRGRKLRGLVELLRPYRGRVVLMLVALVAGDGGVARAAAAGQARDRPGHHAGRRAGARRSSCVAFVASALVYWGATYAQTYLVGWVGQRALAGPARCGSSRTSRALSIGFYSRRKAGVLISRMTNDVQALDQLVTDGVVTLFQSTLTLIGTVVILLLLDVKLALITFLIFPVLALGDRSPSASPPPTPTGSRARRSASITAYLQETLSGVRVVRAFGQEPRHEARFAELNEENREANMKTVYLNAAYFPAVELAVGAGDRR